MRIVLVAFLSLVCGQTLSATGAVAWESSTSWVGGAIPTCALGICNGFSAVEITTSAQVTISQADVILTLPLTLGASAVADTKLILADSRKLAVTGMTWANGHLVLNGSAVLSVGILGMTLEAGASVDRQAVGGTIMLDALAGGNINVNGDGFICNGCGISTAGLSKSISVSSGAWFEVRGSSKVNNVLTIGGSGNCSIAANGELWADAAVTINADTWCRGNLSLSASGSASVQTGRKLIVATGARVQRTTTAATTALTVAAGATLEFSAGASAAVISNANIALTGSLNIVAGARAQAVATGNWEVSGGGSIMVGGRFDIDAAASIQAAIDVSGELRIAAGKAVSLTAATFRNSSKCILNFAGSTFSTVQISGQMTASGSLEVNIPTEPTTVIVLMRASGGISGTFTATVNVGASAAVGRRLLGDGTVTYTSTQVEYHPATTNGSPASNIGLLALAFLPLLW